MFNYAVLIVDTFNTSKPEIRAIELYTVIMVGKMSLILSTNETSRGLIFLKSEYFLRHSMT